MFQHETDDDLKDRSAQRFIRLSLLVILATTILRTMGDAIESIAFPWEMLDLTEQLTSVAGTSIVLMIPWIVLPPVIGKFIDSCDRRSLITSLVMVTQALAISLMILSFFVIRSVDVSMRFFMLLVIYVLMFIISAMDIFHDYFTFTTVSRIVVDKNEQRLQKYNTMLEFSSGITSFVVYPIIGYFFTVIGIEVLGADVLFLLIAAMLLVVYHHYWKQQPKFTYFKTENVSTGTKDGGENRTIKTRLATWKVLLHNKPLLVSFFIIPLFNFAMGSLNMLLIAYFDKHAIKPEFSYSIVLSTETIGFLIGGFLLMSVFKKITSEKGLFMGMMGEALVLLGLGVLFVSEPSIHVLDSSFLLILLFWILYSLSSLLLGVSGASFVQKQAPLENLGSIRGIFDLLATVPILLSKIIVALIVDRLDVGLSSIFLVMGSIAVISSIIFHSLVITFAGRDDNRILFSIMGDGDVQDDHID